jgi:hypothetical protein
VYAPLPEGHVIYRFNSPYPPGSSQGSMQDKPVGLEFLGPVYKTVLLSFPLYYIDTTEAEKILQDVIKYKFTFPEQVAGHGRSRTGMIHVYPNPVRDHLNVAFEIRERTEADLSIYNMRGERVASLAGGPKAAGKYQVSFNAAMLPVGIYNIVLRTTNSVSSQKFVRTR